MENACFFPKQPHEKNDERKINLLRKEVDKDTEEYNGEEIDESLKDFEQWVREVAPDFPVLPPSVTVMEH